MSIYNLFGLLDTREEPVYRTVGETYSLEIKPMGSNLFNNMILTAHGYFNNSKQTIPLKFKWRRVNTDNSFVDISGMNGNSYIISSLDVGFKLEVEAVAADRKADGSEVLRCQFGPIELSKEIKSTLEMIICSGGSKYICMAGERKILLDQRPEKLIIQENAKILHQIQYSKENPVVNIDKYTVDKAKLTVNQVYEDDSGEFKTKKIDEFDLKFASKQAREVFYMLTVFYCIDEDLKNQKIFAGTNFKRMDPENKLGVLDLLSRIKNLHEENSLLLKGKRRLNKEIRSLKEYIVDIEEDFENTMRELNSQPSFDDYPGNESKNRQVFDKMNRKLEKQAEELKKRDATEKALADKTNTAVLEMQSSAEVQARLGKELEEKKRIIQELRETVNIRDNKVKMLEDALETQKNLRVTLEESKFGGEEASLKENIEALNRKIKTIQHDNTALKGQVKLLSKAKLDLQKELEKRATGEDSVLKGKQLAEEKSEQLAAALSSVTEDKAELEAKLREKDNEIDKLQQGYITDENKVVISKSQFEEYDSVMREKDEQDALIMMLQSKLKACEIELNKS